MELPNRKFKIIKADTVRDLMENRDNIYKYMSKKTEIDVLRKIPEKKSREIFA